ncbi:CotS family spore coat protein [Clostridium grantii]|uniref:Spore coat protein, CotS family n=1 Tax=Clostridium grantii DSM 8605 TaxID=1121316 RepID=A0A1M5VPK8_9CLOT|nr:CotS family spore coat protein [Clostridium grantii]SHH77167.1 spore coat protein, CotS family [Clostridium grantii DSM 8605]
MAFNEQLNFNNSISAEEEKILRSILSRYPYKIISISKARSAYKVATDKGNICLKKFQHGKQKAMNGFILVNELKKVGFHNTAEYLKTKKGYVLVRYKNYFFYATEWINGQEVDISTLEETTNTVKLLAEFHISVSKINSSGLKIKDNIDNWLDLYNNKLNDFLMYKQAIDKKLIKSSFDIDYYNSIDIYYNRGVKTLALLRESNYFLLINSVNRETSICHNSFYYQNIIKKDTDYYLIDLDSIIIDLQITDLCKYITRLMNRDEYFWDFDKAKEIIETYSNIKPISKEELKIMLYVMMFPHKFWKLGRKRYIKHKNWNERKFNKKLIKLNSRITKENEFMEKFENYINQ